MNKLLQLEEKLRKAREELTKAKAKHKDKKEDKKQIEEAMDEHNEKKHGEAKDTDSAMKSEVIKFDNNNQWNLTKSDKPTGELEELNKFLHLIPGTHAHKAKTLARETMQHVNASREKGIPPQQRDWHNAQGDAKGAEWAKHHKLPIDSKTGNVHEDHAERAEALFHKDFSRVTNVGGKNPKGSTEAAIANAAISAQGQPTKKSEEDDGKHPKQKTYNEPKEGSYEERNPKPGLKPGEKIKESESDQYRTKKLGDLTPPKSVQRRVYEKSEGMVKFDSQGQWSLEKAKKISDPDEEYVKQSRAKEAKKQLVQQSKEGTPDEQEERRVARLEAKAAGPKGSKKALTPDQKVARSKAIESGQASKVKTIKPDSPEFKALASQYESKKN